MAKEKVAVIGAGMMGVGIAQIFALAGHEVTLQDAFPEALERAPAALRANLTFLAENGLGRLDEVEPAVARVSTTARPCARPCGEPRSWSSASSRTSSSSASLFRAAR